MTALANKTLLDPLEKACGFCLITASRNISIRKGLLPMFKRITLSNVSPSRTVYLRGAGAAGAADAEAAEAGVAGAAVLLGSAAKLTGDPVNAQTTKPKHRLERLKEKLNGACMCFS
jgi:hypothetical protein